MKHQRPLPQRYIVALLLLSASCVDAPTSRTRLANPTLSPSQVKSLVARARRVPRGIEDSFLDADERTGGFGGFFVDSNGTPFVWATRAAKAFDVADQLPPSVRAAITSARLESAVRLEAPYRFSELVAYQQVAASVLRAEPAFIASDADERANRLRIVLLDLKRSDEVLASLEAVGVPRAAVLLERGIRSIAAAGLRDKVRPTGGGLQVKTRVQVSIASYEVPCTLGFNVTLASNSQRYVLYNSHCTGSITGTLGPMTGSTVYQRNIDSRDVIGTVEVNPAWTLSDPLCQVSLCRYSDAALVRSSLSATNTPSRIIYPCSASSNPTLPGTVTTCGAIATVDNAATVFPWVGQPLQKVGRTSGWTVGLVNATCVYEKVPIKEAGTTISVETMSLCSDVVTAYADIADSGSPVFYHPTQIGAAVVAPMGILHSATFDPADPGSVRFYRFSRRQMLELDLGTLVF